MFGSYMRPLLRRSNLTILTGATVTRLISKANRVTAVEFSCRGTNHSVAATSEVVVFSGDQHAKGIDAVGHRRC